MHITRHCQSPHTMIKLLKSIQVFGSRVHLETIWSQFAIFSNQDQFNYCLQHNVSYILYCQIKFLKCHNAVCHFASSANKNDLPSSGSQFGRRSRFQGCRRNRSFDRRSSCSTTPELDGLASDLQHMHVWTYDHFNDRNLRRRLTYCNWTRPNMKPQAGNTEQVRYVCLQFPGLYGVYY